MKRSILNQGFCFFCVFNASGKGLTHFRKDQLRHWRFDPQKPWEDQLHLAPWAGRQRWHLESTSEQGAVRFRFYEMVSQIGNAIPMQMQTEQTPGHVGTVEQIIGKSSHVDKAIVTKK